MNFVGKSLIVASIACIMVQMSAMEKGKPVNPIHQYIQNKYGKGQQKPVEQQKPAQQAPKQKAKETKD